MNRFLRAALIASLFTSLTACSLFNIDCARSDILCVGLVTDSGRLHDYGMTQSAWDGMQQALADSVVQKADAIESVDARDYAKNIAAFTQAHYDVIITSGAGLEEETLQAADLNPATVFIGLNQPQELTHPNFHAVSFPEDQGGFLAGALAASMTTTNIIGAACETAGIASNWRACEGFRAGAEYSNPDIKVYVTYRENGASEDLFKDNVWGGEAVSNMIRDGADVIFGVGGGTGEGALVAAAEAGAWALGSEQDQFYVTREADARLLSSILPQASQVIYTALVSIQKGTLLGALAGSMQLAPYHNAEHFVPADLQERLLELQIKLKSGEIKTNITSEKPK
jgi:basic membrane protein A